MSANSCGCSCRAERAKFEVEAAIVRRPFTHASTNLLVLAALILAVATSTLCHGAVGQLSSWLADLLGPTWWALGALASWLVASLVLHLCGDILAGAPSIERLSDHLTLLGVVGTFWGLMQVVADMGGPFAGASHAMRTSIAAYGTVVIVGLLAGFRPGQPAGIEDQRERPR